MEPIPLPLSLGQPLLSSVSEFDFFYILHISDATQYLLFSVWLTSHSITPSKLGTNFQLQGE